MRQQARADAGLLAGSLPAQPAPAVRMWRADTMAAIASTFRAVVGPVVTVAHLTARLAVGYGPIVVAWVLAGSLANYIVIQAAGWLAAWNTLAGLALMPFATLSWLFALVAILLSLRDGLPQLSKIAPVPRHGAERRREFVDAALAGILPFFAFYVALGSLRDDMSKYYLRLTAVLYARNQLGGPNDGALTVTRVTVAIVVITFILRRVVKRFEYRQPRLLPLIAVYLEAVWVLLSLWVVGDLIGGVVSWVSTRQGVVWIVGFREAIAQRAAPLDWILEFAGWVIGEFSGLMLRPIGWLTIAGVIYGQAIQPPSTSGSLVAERLGLNSRLAPVRERLGGVPGWLRRRVQDFWNDLIDRFRPIGDVLKLMWHVGPVMIAGYVLFYWGSDWVEAILNRVVAQLIGPRSIGFWERYDNAVFLIPPALVAPIGFGLIAAGYDAVMARSVRDRIDLAGGDPPPAGVKTRNEAIVVAPSAAGDHTWSPPGN